MKHDMAMYKQIYKWVNRKYPQNYIIKNPYIGTLIITLFCFCFTLLYKPLNTHKAKNFSYEETMAIYCFVLAIPVFASIKFLKTINYFSKRDDWTIIKELSSIIIVLVGIAIAIYFIGFFIEQPAQRWNLSTFLNSCRSAFLTGIIPFSIFSVMNYHYLLPQSLKLNDKNKAIESGLNQPSEEKIQINSKLKKEELSFYPSQFIYVESDGNYVTFYINQNNQIRKVTIRNSISSIEKQLSKIPYYFRTHRAYIVNLRRVRNKLGNALGYRLKLIGTDIEIPVSRQNTRLFDKRFTEFRN